MHILWTSSPAARGSTTWRSSTGSDAGVNGVDGIGRHPVPSLKAEAGGPARCRTPAARPGSICCSSIVFNQARSGLDAGRGSVSLDNGERSILPGKKLPRLFLLPPLQGVRTRRVDRRAPRSRRPQAGRVS